MLQKCNNSAPTDHFTEPASNKWRYQSEAKYDRRDYIYYYLCQRKKK